LLTSLAAPVAGMNVGLMALTASSPGGDQRLLTLHSGLLGQPRAQYAARRG